MSNIFEPPLDTPLTNRKMSSAMERGYKNVSSSAGKQSKAQALESSKAKVKEEVSASGEVSSIAEHDDKIQCGSKPAKNKHNIHMKVVDDKLRIIGGVPSSAVELSVKEKFLKKVQRQERIVEEIKLVLKPYYNRKKINKDDYKDILRKCVPKIYHSKIEEIDPGKIKKFTLAYLKKLEHLNKKNSVDMKS